MAELPGQSIYLTDEESPDCAKGNYSAFRYRESTNEVEYGCWTLNNTGSAVVVSWWDFSSTTLYYHQLKKAEYYE